MPEIIEFVSAKQVNKEGGPSERQQRRLIEAGRFPKPVPLSEGRKAFVRSELEAWKQARIAERDKGANKTPDA